LSQIQSEKLRKAADRLRRAAMKAALVAQSLEDEAERYMQNREWNGTRYHADGSMLEAHELLEHERRVTLRAKIIDAAHTYQDEFESLAVQLMKDVRRMEQFTRLYAEGRLDF
jgi:hypothetical protein